MAERELLLSPQDDGAAVELSSRVYRKRILPKATIHYRGRKITFDDQYLHDLANSFQQGAYDQVAFMMAPDNNSHTLDPERFRGEIKDVEVGDDGLYGIFQVTPEAAKVLEQNPKLGVSARILENYSRSDGKQFPRALQHVLGTLDPVIPGLGSWEEVALSNGIDPGNVIDLSELSYEELEPVTTRAENLQQVAAATDMTVEDLEALDMTDDELAIFASAFVDTEPAAEAAAESAEDDELVEEPGEQGDLFAAADEATDEALPSEEEIEAAVEALSDEELTALAAELGIPADEELEAAEEAGEEEATAEVETAEEAEEVAEPTDAELAERLGTGEFGSGIDEPVEDPDLGDLTDEALAEMTEMWETAHAADDATGAEEAAAVAAEAAETAETAVEATEVAAEAAETVAETPQLVGAGSVSLSNEAAPEVVALSNQVSTLQQQLAEQQFDTLKREYVRQGVPSALVDLARPVLVAGRALEFSNSVGDTVDPADIVRQLLDSATGYIDLARERGHSYSPEAEDKAAMAAEEDKRLASLWGEQYGI